MFHFSQRKHPAIHASLHKRVPENLISLSVVESEPFKDLIGLCEPRYQVPSRKHFTSKLLYEKSVEVKNDLTHHLKMAQDVCVTIDLWSNRQMESFICITGHYILDWTLKSVMLACKGFKGKHTADNIAKEFDETMCTFEIFDKIEVTDNASNMINAFKIPSFESISDKSESSDSDESDDENEVPDDLLYEYIPFKRESCMCHNIHLVVKDGLKSAGVLNKAISKASNIVSHIRRSTTASDLLEGENRVQTATSTRWNSQLTMIKSLLSISTEKLKQLDVPQLTSHDRMYLNELVEILTPFEQATLSVQNEKTVSASLVIPVVKNLLNEIDSLSVKFNCSLVSSLKESVQKRLSPFLKCKDFQCASILDH